MRLLIDTHLLIWGATDDDRLSAKARSILEGRENQLVFSVVSIWEVAIKFELRRPDFPHNPRILRDALLDHDYSELEISSRHALALIGLPKLHGDPFDRLLIAQSIAEKIPLLTADADVAAYGGEVMRA